MARANWKLPILNYSLYIMFFKKVPLKVKKKKIIFSKKDLIVKDFELNVLQVYNGFSFISLIAGSSLLGFYSGCFISTRKGRNITKI